MALRRYPSEDLFREMMEQIADGAGHADAEAAEAAHLEGIEELDDERAAALIMTARAPWFEQEDEATGG